MSCIGVAIAALALGALVGMGLGLSQRSPEMSEELRLALDRNKAASDRVKSLLRDIRDTTP